jgi:hypothetical protein
MEQHPSLEIVKHVRGSLQRAVKALDEVDRALRLTPPVEQCQCRKGGGPEPIDSFISECLFNGVDEKSGATVTWLRWKKWAGQMGIRAYTQTWFGRRLGLRFDRTKIGGYCYYRGFALRPEVDPH